MTKPTVLIVDDEQKNIKLLKGILHGEHCHTLDCPGGEQALQVATDCEPDLIVLDVMMPGIDGFEVCRRLKAHSATSAIPVIFVTALGDEASELRGLELGGVDYISKPFNAALVKARIRTQLELKRHQDSTKALLQDRTHQLAQSQASFRDLVENSPVGIAIVRKGRCLYQNPAQQRIYPLAPTRPITAEMRNVHPDDREKVQRACADLIAGRVSRIELDFRFYPEGRQDPVTNLRWAQGRATSFIFNGESAVLLNLVDLTELKQLERQLIMKDKLLSLGRVAAGIAHEIRNPLTGINSYLYTLEDLCRSQPQDPEELELMRQIVEQIQGASNKIESVIKRVMDFSKPGRPKMVWSDLNATLEEAVQLSQVALRKAGIQLERDLAHNLPPCLIDPHLIEQVVLNLITNAARALASKADGKRIEIVSRTRNGCVCFQVADSGPGVSAQIKDKIFEPFFTTTEDGSGIGLNVAQRIVADHNGTIALESSRWGGAAFTVELPVRSKENLP